MGIGLRLSLGGMQIHPLLFGTLALSLLLFFAGWRLSKDWRQFRSWQTALFFCSCGLGLPGVMFATYYTHWIDDWVILYQLRSLTGSEFAFSLLALPAGMVSRIFSVVSRVFFLVMAVMAAILPFVKPMIAPLDYDGLRDIWRDDVCIQSGPSTCGPSSTATIFRSYGVETTQQELAREAMSYQGGTECWHLARAIRKRGYEVQFHIKPSGLPDKIPTPAIAGVRMGDIGHFIAVLEDEDGELVIGDPMYGRSKASRERFQEEYDFTGFYMSIQPPK